MEDENKVEGEVLPTEEESLEAAAEEAEGEEVLDGE